MIWQTAEERIISDGNFMLPVPRKIPAKRVHQPRQHGAAEKDLHVSDGVSQHVAATAQQVQQSGPKISITSMNVKPKLMPISSACVASVEARSVSPAPSARAMADATPPPIAPPDMVMVRITNGNTSAIAASNSTPSRPI